MIINADNFFRGNPVLLPHSFCEVDLAHNLCLFLEVLIADWRHTHDMLK